MNRINRKNGDRYAIVILIGCFVQFAVLAGLYINIGQLFEPVATTHGFTMGQMAAVSTFMGIGSMLTIPLAGRLLDRVDIRIILTGGNLAFNGALLSFILWSELWQFYLVCFLSGLAVGVSVMITVPVVVGNWFYKRLGLAMSLAMSSSAIGSAAISPIMGYLLFHLPWETAVAILFLSAIVMVTPVSLFVIRLRPEDKGMYPYGYDPEDPFHVQAANGKADGMSEKEAVKSLSFWLILLTFGMMQFMNGFLAMLPSFGRSLGMTAIGASTLITISMLGNLVFKLSFGYLSDRFQFQRVLYGLLFIVLAGFGFIYSSRNAVSVLLYAGIIGFGASQSYVSVAGPLFTRRTFGSKDYSKIYSHMVVSQTLFGAISPPIAGYIFDATGSYSGMLVLFIGAALVSIIFVYINRKIINEREGSQI
ncbi:MFS transporter [Alkalibacter rhizosphaerae]|uniref:MFS transporter n=1 Tax=Alkalibacter rhizosphaerae TaxID=2815577 RepID=A0A974XEW5_9FIRM|nr:MFS transporter [Alkalibacter rhizosphaerae]QSX08548.1 MFS transporter [Alkalibacter rhizosphaerae]